LQSEVAEVVQRDRTVPRIADALGELCQLRERFARPLQIAADDGRFRTLPQRIRHGELVAGGDTRGVGVVCVPRCGGEVAEPFRDSGAALVDPRDEARVQPASARKRRVDPASGFAEAPSKPDEEREAADDPERDLGCGVERVGDGDAKVVVVGGHSLAPQLLIGAATNV
jgi:hypothetical protein